MIENEAQIEPQINDESMLQIIEKLMAHKCDKLAKRGSTNQTQIRNLRSDGRTGAAKCAGRAEALELVKNVVKFHPARFVPRTAVADLFNHA